MVSYIESYHPDASNDPWNYHIRIPVPQGCVPVENVTQTSSAVHLSPEMIPSVSEAVRMHEERGGNLAGDASKNQPNQPVFS